MTKRRQLPGPETSPFYPAGERKGAFHRHDWPEPKPFTGDEKDREAQDREAAALRKLRAPIVPREIEDIFPSGVSALSDIVKERPQKRRRDR